MDEQTNTPPQTPNDEASLRELALALIAARYPDATDEASGERPQLLPGKLPPSFPANFPLPPGSRVVGSLVAARPTIALDTHQSAEEVIAFYTEQLTAAGWNAPEGIPPRQGGFVHSSFGMAGRTHALFYRDDGRGLNIVTQTAANGRTSVLISQMPEGAGPMRHGARNRMMHYDIFSILPVIMPPPRSQQYQEGGSGGGGDRVIANARVETDLDLAALAAHYTAQLERGGWQRTDGGGVSDPVAWSTWNFESEEKEPWRALFVILKRPDVPRRYWVHLLGEWAGERPHSSTGALASLSHWTSHSTLASYP